MFALFPEMSVLTALFYGCLVIILAAVAGIALGSGV